VNPRDRVAPKEFGREFLRALFDAALAAADPHRAIAASMPAAVSGPHGGGRRRQGVGGDGARLRDAMAGPA
jgi:glycerate-2-kinase